jgi:hypothetical protein
MSTASPLSAAPLVCPEFRQSLERGHQQKKFKFCLPVAFKFSASNQTACTAAVLQLLQIVLAQGNNFKSLQGITLVIVISEN